MIQQTVGRLLPLAPANRFWIITNDDLRPAILKQLPKLPKAQAIAEPVGRNTLPPSALPRFFWLREHPDAVIGMFPSDHVIANEKSYRATIERGRRSPPEAKTIVVLASGPNRAETATDNIEAGSARWRRAARAPFHREARRGKSCRFCGGGKLFLEQWKFL